MPRLDDVLQFLVAYLRNLPTHTRYGNAYGYDLYIPAAGRAYAQDQEAVPISDPSALERRAGELTPVFYDAAWELCRRGILRPSVRRQHEQYTDDGSAGNGYSITSLGRKWLQEAEHALYVPMESSRFAELVNSFGGRLGDGFLQRAREASKCYFATAYLACCAMCGAAAESVLLRIATEKSGDEQEVLRIYRTSRGRSEIEKLIRNGLSGATAATFANLTDLLKYWRDNAAHGTSSHISELEAYESLTRLLRLAQFATDNWDELTQH